MEPGLREWPVGEVTLLRFNRLSRQPGLVHAFTLRPWNMAPHRGPQAELAVERRRRLCQLLGLDFERLTAPAQVHGPEVVPVERSLEGAGRFGRDEAVGFVDGLVTDRPGLPLLNLSGDCVLLLLYDPRRGALGTAHASWRGIVAGVTENLVRQLTRSFGCRPDHVLAGIGPSAGPCCYRVERDVCRIVASRFDDAGRYLLHKNGATFLDMWRLVADQLAAAGVPAGNVEVAGCCTMCDRRFFSHRREGPSTGRFALICSLT